MLKLSAFRPILVVPTSVRETVAGTVSFRVMVTPVGSASPPRVKSAVFTV